MTLLDCAVTGCAYNEDRCCCKGNIKVEREARRCIRMRPAAEALWSAGRKNCGCNVKEHESKTDRCGMRGLQLHV